MLISCTRVLKPGKTNRIIITIIQIIKFFKGKSKSPYREIMSLYKEICLLPIYQGNMVVLLMAAKNISLYGDFLINGGLFLYSEILINKHFGRKKGFWHDICLYCFSLFG
jgi:hypothetical protein